MDSSQFYSESDLENIWSAHLQSSQSFRELLRSDNSLLNKVEDKTGRSILHLAVRWGNIETVKVVIEFETDINRVDKYGLTSLHTLVKYFSEPIAKLLIESGANVNQKTHRGETVLHRAATRHNVDAVLFLLENGANVNEVDNWGSTALHEAATGRQRGDEFQKRLDIVNLLIQFNADVNLQDKIGQTPLHKAVFCASPVVDALLIAGAKVDIKDKVGRCPLDIAGVLNERGLYIHIRKLKLAGQNVSVKKPHVLGRMLKRDTFDLEDELKKIKIVNVCEDFYLGTLLAKSSEPYFLRNEKICENLTKLLHAPEFLLEFPLFGHIFKNVFKDAQHRIRLLDSALEWMSSEESPKCLRELVLETKENILEYFSNDELRKLINSAED